MPIQILIEPPRAARKKFVVKPAPQPIWPWSLAGVFAFLVLMPFTIPIHGAPAISTAIMDNGQWTVEFQRDAYLERNLREFVSAVYRDYDRLTGGLEETWYHEALAAEYHAERTLAMIDRALSELKKEARHAGTVEALEPMRAWYAQLVRQLRLHRAGLTPGAPREPLELMPTPPAQVPRYDG